MAGKATLWGRESATLEQKLEAGSPLGPLEPGEASGNLLDTMTLCFLLFHSCLQAPAGCQTQRSVPLGEGLGPGFLLGVYQNLI